MSAAVCKLNGLLFGRPARRRFSPARHLFAVGFWEFLKFGDLLKENSPNFKNAFRMAVDVAVICRHNDLRPKLRRIIKSCARKRNDAIALSDNVLPPARIWIAANHIVVGDPGAWP